MHVSPCHGNQEDQNLLWSESMEASFLFERRQSSLIEVVIHRTQHGLGDWFLFGGGWCVGGAPTRVVGGSVVDRLKKLIPVIAGHPYQFCDHLK